MRIKCLIIVFAVLACGELRAQTLQYNPNRIRFTEYAIQSKTYANSTNDTTGTYNIPWLQAASLLITYNDSVNVITYVQYRSTAASSWSTVATDTVNHTGGGVVSTSTYRIVSLISSTTNVFGGYGGEARIVQVHGSSVNGVTTPTKSIVLRYKH